MRSLVVMRELGYPVMFDATHSLQLPGGLGNASGGDRKYIPALARAGVAAGVDALFMEVHEDPDHAKSDGPNSLKLEDFEGLLRVVKRLDALVREAEGGGIVKSDKVLKRAESVLRLESDGILSMIERLDESFVGAVQLLRQCRGKVVVTGLGKSGLICRKIAATLASTGTPAFFLHSGDAVHGDVGMVMQGDVVLAISNSGETDEILKLLPHFKLHGIKLIVMTGNPESSLAQAGDVVLNVRVEEACPLGLAPTTSTTVALAMGDALAVVLLEEKGFKEEDFAVRHPGGILGRKLILRVEDMMHQGDHLPLVRYRCVLERGSL